MVTALCLTFDLKLIYIIVCINNNDLPEVPMKTAKVFITGRSQAVRLPKEFRFTGDDVFINKIGNIVVLIPKDDPWSSLADSLDKFTDDFMESREQGTQDSRDPV